MLSNQGNSHSSACVSEMNKIVQFLSLKMLQPAAEASGQLEEIRTKFKKEKMMLEGAERMLALQTTHSNIQILSLNIAESKQRLNYLEQQMQKLEKLSLEAAPTSDCCAFGTCVNQSICCMETLCRLTKSSFDFSELHSDWRLSVASV
jgi:paraquat-inducible protein B